jgi:hypothetical protein
MKAIAHYTDSRGDRWPIHLRLDEDLQFLASQEGLDRGGPFAGLTVTAGEDKGIHLSLRRPWDLLRVLVHEIGHVEMRCGGLDLAWQTPGLHTFIDNMGHAVCALVSSRAFFALIAGKVSRAFGQKNRFTFWPGRRTV